MRNKKLVSSAKRINSKTFDTLHRSLNKYISERGMDQVLNQVLNPIVYAEKRVQV